MNVLVYLSLPITIPQHEDALGRLHTLCRSGGLNSAPSSDTWVSDSEFPRMPIISHCNLHQNCGRLEGHENAEELTYT
jgi:hypothetical protein